MTKEQYAKYGTIQYDRQFLEEHITEKYNGAGKKECGVTIKVKTLEEQKKEEGEKERKRKENEEKEKAKKEATKTAENLQDMFDPNNTFYTTEVIYPFAQYYVRLLTLF